MKTFWLLLVCIAVTVNANLGGAIENSFRSFMIKYQKVYTNIEEANLRFEIFQQNLAKVEELNKKNPSATFGVTKFSDLTSEEFKLLFLNYRKNVNVDSRVPKSTVLPKFPNIPVSFDWSVKGAVTPVKNQKACGSSWAFSVVEAIESQFFMSGIKLVSLSAQQLVDCDNRDQGCEGGDPITAYGYIIQQGGLESEASYPYTAVEGTCNYQRAESVVSVQDWSYITQTHNETEMQIGLLYNGPISICADATSWQFYVQGVVSSSCGNTPIPNICVTITGFQDYSDFTGKYHVWNVRNSWGDDWGMKGYIYIERGSNYCGVADEVTVPSIN